MPSVPPDHSPASSTDVSSPGGLPRGRRGFTDWRRWRVPVALAAALAAAWTWGVGQALPSWLKPRIEAAATEALGAPVQLGGLEIQPWRLIARVQGLRVGPADQPLLKVRQAEAQVSLASLWHRAPVLSRLEMDQPEVSLVRLDAQRFNISPLLTHWRARAAAVPAEEGAEPARFAVFNIRLTGGVLRYDDQVLKQQHVVDGLTLGVPFVSSLPSQIDVAVQPLLKARINGSPLEISGTTLPFQSGHRSEITLNWREVDVAQWLRHAQPLLPAPWSISPRAGSLATELTVVFEQLPEAEQPRLLVQGGAVLSGLDLDVTGLPVVPVAGQTLGPVGLGWQTLRLEGLQWQPLQQQFSLARVRLEGGRLALSARSGRGARGGGDAAPVAWPRLQAIQGQAQALSSQPGAAPATWQLSLADEAGSRVQAQGRWQLAQGQGELRWDVSEGAVPAWWQALALTTTVPVAPQEGRLSTQGTLALSTQPALAWRLTDGQAALEGVRVALQPALPAGPGDELAWQTLRLMGIEARSGTAPTDDLQWAVADVTLAQARGRWQDTQQRPAARWQFDEAQVRVQGLSQDLGQELTVNLQTRAQGAGRLSYEGRVRPQPLQVQGQVGVQSLALRVLQPYLAPHLNVTLESALAQAQGRLNLSWRPRPGLADPAQAWTVRYQGQLGLDRLHLIDQVNQADVLRWKRLALRDTDLRWMNGAVQADLGRIALQDFYGRVIVQPDGRLNLAQLVRRAGEADAPASLTTPQDGATAAAAPPPPPAAPSAPAEAPQPGPDLRWRSITVAGGQVDFTDLFIRPNYSARLTQLAGTVSAVAARQPEPADVQLAGKVDDAAPLTIQGRLHPLGPQLYTDLAGSAKGVELTRLTPYAARYAGYAIERGTLSVDVRYKVEGGQLQASNRVFLDQLTFGDPSGHPEATRLPVRLAVALLKNSRGEIDINLPISGSLDDPQFSVGGILWRVVVNLVTKAVTAPFALLMGSDSNDAGQVMFEPGRATLSEAARQQLDALGAKLLDRPSLKLDAVGQAQGAVDEAGLREAHVQGLMRQAKAKALNLPLEGVQVPPNETERWLAAAYSAADIKKPRNLVGLPKTVPPAEQRALLAAAAPADAAALKALADRRADVVKAYLIERLPADRVRLAASKVLPAAETAAPGGLAGVLLSLQ